MMLPYQIWWYLVQTIADWTVQGIRKKTGRSWVCPLCRRLAVPQRQALCIQFCGERFWNGVGLWPWTCGLFLGFCIVLFWHELQQQTDELFSLCLSFLQPVGHTMGSQHLTILSRDIRSLETLDRGGIAALEKIQSVALGNRRWLRYRYSSR